MITPADIESMLDMIEKARAKMEALTNNLTQMRVLLYIGPLTYEHAYESWVRDIKPQGLKWAKSCRYCFQEFAKWCREGGVSKKKWRSIKRKLDALNRAYLSFQSAEAEFTHHLTVEWNGRKSFREGKEVGEREGFEKGRLKGHDEVLSGIGKHDEVTKRAEKAEAELAKRWRQWGKTRCEEWAKKRFLDLGNAKGPSEAISRLLDDKEFVETCKHFGFFGATDETPPTEAALKKRWTRHKKGTDPLDTPKVKKPKHPKAKKPERGFADDGVKPELPKERYRE